MNQPKICPTCHQVIAPKKPARLCGDCCQVIRRHEHWHVGPDSRIRHNDCPPRPKVTKVEVRRDAPSLFEQRPQVLTITEVDQPIPVNPGKCREIPVEGRVPEIAQTRIGRAMTLAEIKEVATAAYAPAKLAEGAAAGPRPPAPA